MRHKRFRSGAVAAGLASAALVMAAAVPAIAGPRHLARPSADAASVPSVTTPTVPNVTTTTSASSSNCSFTPKAVGALVTDVSAGSSITMDCTGFPDEHPYLLIEMSLTVAVDPAAQPLLAGDVTSVAGIEAVAAAVPEINALSTVEVTSDSTGDIDYDYTVPTTQPPGQGASCPPTTQEFDSGLIGCVVAMIDPEAGGAVTAGTFVLNYAGQTLFPPSPTVALSVSQATDGQSVSVGDAPNATRYWWLATLAYLYEGLSGGGGGSSTVPVVVRVHGHKLASDAAVTPASYSNGTFTPPVLSGHFIARGQGLQKVVVSLTQSLLGFPLSISASTYLSVKKAR